MPSKLLNCFGFWTAPGHHSQKVTCCFHSALTGVDQGRSACWRTKPFPFHFVRAGFLYFTRRVPKDLIHHYTIGKISFSLRTRSAAVAKSRAQSAAQQLNENWYHLRIQDLESFVR
ncbi:DUF6538 domain-containing protein [Ruegeria lacuscaerulensis]|uniref:DUF6538 domain-containing protein n=1 Tax=Ruegeria lacuscaerulensis TaxID=55218 RepID=UPI003AF90EAF